MMRAQWLCVLLAMVVGPVMADVPAPFVPIVVHEESRTLLVAGREIRLSRLGYPESCRSYFNEERTHLEQRPVELLQDAVLFSHVIAFDAMWYAESFRFLEKSDAHVSWQVDLKLSRFKVVLQAEMDYAGRMKYAIDIPFVGDLRLDVAARTEAAVEFEGLGRAKGPYPVQYFKSAWDNRDQKEISYWCGSSRGGYRVTLCDNAAGTDKATWGPRKDGPGVTLAFNGVCTCRGMIAAEDRTRESLRQDEKGDCVAVPARICFGFDVTPCEASEILVPLAETKKWQDGRLASLEHSAELAQKPGFLEALRVEPPVNLDVRHGEMVDGWLSDATIETKNGLRMVSRDSEEPCRHCVDEIWLGECLLGALDVVPVLLEDGTESQKEAYWRKVINSVHMRHNAAQVLVSLERDEAKFGLSVLPTQTRGRMLAVVSAFYGEGPVAGFLMRFYPNPKTFAGFSDGLVRFSDDLSLRLSTESVLASPMRLIDTKLGTCVECRYDLPDPVVRTRGFRLWSDETAVANALYLVLEAKDALSEQKTEQEEPYSEWRTISFKGRNGVLQGERGAKMYASRDEQGRVTVEVDGDTKWTSHYVDIPARIENTRISSVGSVGNCAYWLKGIRIEDGVAIEQGAFSQCKNLRTVRLPADLREIREATFQDCVDLKEVKIPDGVTRIGAYAFERSGLWHVTIPDAVEVIEVGAFHSCRNLAYVSLPAKVKLEMDSYGDDPFAGCDTFRLKIERRK